MPFCSYATWAQHPEAFYDIVIGDNACVMDGVPCCEYGYFCVKGFDAVSGLGQPYFNQLAKYVNDPLTPQAAKES